MDTSAYKKTNLHAGWPAFFLFAKYIINTPINEHCHFKNEGMHVS